ncbi:MAG: hypothetical protein HZB99_02735 [Candidatus Harrisonbacteria bacterium]|nr:hypothetical protein [Candidatus Harrisonbacteria bacterium]
MTPEWLKPKTGEAALMYLAHPSRNANQGERLKAFVDSLGYEGIDPFDIQGYKGRNLEKSRVGRSAILKLDLNIQRSCGSTGVFGISEGVMGEWRDRLEWDPAKNIRIFRGDAAGEFDGRWDEEYEKLSKDSRYGDVSRDLRGRYWLIDFVGPRAIGKTYWTEKLKKKFGSKLQRVRNVTTRQPRDENDRKYYYFLAKEQFEEGIRNCAFLEHDHYRDEHDHRLDQYYGSSLDETKSVLRDSHGIMALTPRGTEALYGCRYEINVAIILLRPASDEVLKKNLERRGIKDSQRQAVFIEDAKKFCLPDTVEHRELVLTSTRADEERVFGMIEPLLK